MSTHMEIALPLLRSLVIRVSASRSLTSQLSLIQLRIISRQLLPPLKAWTPSRTQTGTARRPVPYIKKATRILVIRSLAQAHLRTAKPQEGIGLPVRALAPTARRQPRATAGRWVIRFTIPLAIPMVVRQRPDRLWIVSKVRKSGARASVGASPAKVHAI